jgi:hypothetical protein
LAGLTVTNLGKNSGVQNSQNAGARKGTSRAELSGQRGI